MVIESSAPALPAIVTEITLYHAVKRIDLSYRLVLDRTPLREVLVCFPFGAEEPRFSYGSLGTTLRAFEDVVAGANTNQYACGHWCRVEDGELSCVLATTEARITQFGGIHPTAVSQAHRQISPAGFDKPYVGREEITKGHIVSMPVYNNCRTNFAPTQAGEVIFRYAITSGRAVSAEAFAESVAYPPILTVGERSPRGITLDADNVSVTCFKPAEDGRGVILRLKENEGRSTAFALRCTHSTVTSATVCDLLEEERVSVSPDALTIGAYETLTIRLRLTENE
jgi:hypothetical protein